jgi:hypothetical protein
VINDCNRSLHTAKKRGICQIRHMAPNALRGRWRACLTSSNLSHWQVVCSIDAYAHHTRPGQPLLVPLLLPRCACEELISNLSQSLQKQIGARIRQQQSSMHLSARLNLCHHFRMNGRKQEQCPDREGWERRTKGGVRRVGLGGRHRSGRIKETATSHTAYPGAGAPRPGEETDKEGQKKEATSQAARIRSTAAS